MLILSAALMYFAYHPAIGLVGRVLLLFSTLAHEMGHGLTAILVGGEFETLKIQWDASGVTHTRFPHGRIPAALISGGGLVGPSIAAAFLFWTARGSEKRQRWVTYLLSAFLMVAGLLTARSIWALVFTVGLSPLLWLAAAKLSKTKLESLLVFIGVQLGISVFTRSDYLFTESAGPGRPSDVAQMAESLFLPFWFWGILCGGISLLVLAGGFWCYTKED